MVLLTNDPPHHNDVVVVSDDNVTITIPHILVSDLLRDLLLCLPLKSLFRFALVCKQWHSLILKDPTFRLSAISNQNPTPLALLIFSQYKHWRSVSPSIHDSLNIVDYIPFACPKTFITPLKSRKSLSMIALQSCNGLLLCCYDDDFGRRVSYEVCNLATKKTRLLPEPDGKGKVWSKVSGMCLAFDPDKSPYYEVVAVMTVGYNVYQIYIYSSDTKLWRVSGDSFDYDHIDYAQGVYWNGGIHWIDACLSESSIYFDIKNGMFKTIPSVPKKSDRVEVRGHGYIFGERSEKNKYYFGESCGNLHFVESGFMLLDIYEMKKDYSEWFIKQSVDLLDMTTGDGFGIFSIVCDEFRILSVVCGENDDDPFLVLRVSGQIIRCNLVSKTCERLRDIADDVQMNAFHYVESLCSV